MPASQQLYFVAIVPPAELAGEIQDLKHYFRDEYQSSHSLNAPPHVTLLSPFRLDQKKEKELILFLEELSCSFSPFEVAFNDFSTFPPRVIFIDIEKTDSLMQVQEELEARARSNPELFGYNYGERPYHPHLTLAFKDLTKTNFYRAWKEFKNKEFNGEFKADKISLLKHNGQEWEVVGEFGLN